MDTKYAIIRITKNGLVKSIFLEDEDNDKHVTDNYFLATGTLTIMKKSYPSKTFKLVSWEE